MVAFKKVSLDWFLHVNPAVSRTADPATLQQGKCPAAGMNLLRDQSEDNSFFNASSSLITSDCAP